MMGLLSTISFLIDLILLREFMRDQLLERVIDRLMNVSNLVEPIAGATTQQQTLKPQVQSYVIDYLLENT